MVILGVVAIAVGILLIGPLGLGLIIGGTFAAIMGVFTKPKQKQDATKSV
jgi:hypothetical protein